VGRCQSDQRVRSKAETIYYYSLFIYEAQAIAELVQGQPGVAVVRSFKP
jgi:hypothetical protein